MAALAVFAPFASSMRLADAALCSKSAFDASYLPIKAQMDACANRTGIPLALPLAPPQKKVLCTVCTQLAEVVRAETAVPDCGVLEQDGTTIKLLRLLHRLLRPCMGGSSASDSSSGSLDTDSTPKTPVTAMPGSTLPSTGGPLSSNSTTSIMPPTTEAGTSLTVGALVGIVAGAVVVLVLIAAVLLSRRRKKATTRHLRPDSDKLDASSLGGGRDDGDDDGPSTGCASTTPFQFSLTSSKKHASRTLSFRPSSVQGPGVNLWEDPVIVAARIPKDKVLVTSLLSRGGFGEVYQGGYNRQPMVSLGRLRVQFTPNALPEVVELGKSCVALDPKKRPSASDVLFALHGILKDQYH
ncbi:hypothetical protein PybrP1_001940 [[Pythium] brassicae (nom. inval.)]|nr:hypothetical protein PybrP1_001940 [[Pythium] brassicae (nom. inval.)]